MPIPVKTKQDYTELDHLLDKSMAYFKPHASSYKVYDRSQSNAALGDEHAGDFPMDEDTLRAYARWYVTFLTRTQPRRVMSIAELSR